MFANGSVDDMAESRHSDGWSRVACGLWYMYAPLKVQGLSQLRRASADHTQPPGDTRKKRDLSRYKAERALLVVNGRTGWRKGRIRLERAT